AAGLLAAIAGVLGRQRRSSGDAGESGETGASARSRLPARFRRDKRPRYACDCGQAYRVTGVDRHRVYWPEGAQKDEPVLGDTCIACDRALPAGHDTAVAG
ncbi:MAG TPA: hypothetical protein VE526_11645, partial [Solirubrobacteraceae bacterium]|nr:hypothetical protein [Solirubrobacteraceae bacterium]